MKRALISVSNKSNLEYFTQSLVDLNFKILTTGGTYTKLQNFTSNNNLIKIEDYTGQAEVLDGRVKTLHPKIHAGILARKDQFDELKKLKFDPIDLVVANLYPFESVISSQNTSFNEAIENIDIGGVTLLRAAAKNSERVLVLSDPNDYNEALENLIDGTTEEQLNFRKMCATKAFIRTCEYDASISEYLSNGVYKTRIYEKEHDLKYGLNPHQSKSAIYSVRYPNNRPIIKDERFLEKVFHLGGGKLYQYPPKIEVLNGTPSYINILDAHNAYSVVRDLSMTLKQPAAASFKHTSPAGVAVAIPLSKIEKEAYHIEDDKFMNDLSVAFVRARNGDAKSSFGDFIGLSEVVDEETAKLIKKEVSDGIIAPGYSPAAFSILSKKKKGNYVIMRGNMNENYLEEFRELNGIAISQTPNFYQFGYDDINIVTKNTKLYNGAERDLIIANVALKYSQSNSVAFASNGQIIGLGCGQQNRVDCIKIAGRKALVWQILQRERHQLYANANANTNSNAEGFDKLKRQDIINAEFDFADKLADKLADNIRLDFDISMASDGFFPFTDSIKVAHKFGVKVILQPGGSLADKRVIEECDKLNIPMACSGVRIFTH